jgi:hypothetical protein
VEPNDGVDTNSPQFAQAFKACKKLYPKITISAQQSRRELSQGLKYSACMRAHGLTNYPDPSMFGGGVMIPITDTNSPQYPAAVQACRSLSPGGGS